MAVNGGYKKMEDASSEYHLGLMFKTPHPNP